MPDGNEAQSFGEQNSYKRTKTRLSRKNCDKVRIPTALYSRPWVSVDHSFRLRVSSSRSERLSENTTVEPIQKHRGEALYESHYSESADIWRGNKLGGAVSVAGAMVGVDWNKRVNFDRLTLSSTSQHRCALSAGQRRPTNTIRTGS